MDIFNFFKETKWSQLTILVDYIQNLSALKINLTNRGKISFNIAPPVNDKFDWKNANRIDLDFAEISKIIIVLDRLISLVLSNKITASNKELAVNSIMKNIFDSHNNNNNNQQIFANLFHLYNGNISNLNFIKPTDVAGNKIGTLFSLQIFKKRNGKTLVSNFYPINIHRAILLRNTLKAFEKDIIILSHLGYTLNQNSIDDTINSNTVVDLSNIEMEDM